MRYGTVPRSVGTSCDCEMERQCINSFEDSQQPETRKEKKHAESNERKKKHNKPHRGEVKAKLRISLKPKGSVVCANLYSQYVYVNCSRKSMPCSGSPASGRVRG